MICAASSGQTAMCEYLYSQHYPWSAAACDEAAAGVHLETLRWLHEHGCPWATDQIILAAAHGGSIAVMQYLQQQGVVTTVEQLTDMLLHAGVWEQLQAAQWLRQQGAEWPTVLHYDRDEWRGDVLAWARAEGCDSPLNTDNDTDNGTDSDDDAIIIF
jgi:hypothetical protein